MDIYEFIFQSEKWRTELNLAHEPTYPPDYPEKHKDYLLRKFREEQLPQIENGLRSLQYEEYDELHKDAANWQIEKITQLKEAYSSPANYVVQENRWRAEFAIPGFLPYEEKVNIANQKLENIDRDHYADLFSDAEIWRQSEMEKVGLTLPFSPNDNSIRTIIFQAGNRHMKISVPYGSDNYRYEQGEIKSVDWCNGTLLLRSQYGSETTIYFSNINHVE